MPNNTDGQTERLPLMRQHVCWHIRGMAISANCNRYGNIRELQHTIEKAVILSDSGELRAESLQLPVAEKVETAVVEEKEKIAFHTLDEMERTMIQQALDQCGSNLSQAAAKLVDQCGSNLSQAAAKLGITRQTLYNKMKRYGL